MPNLLEEDDPTPPPSNHRRPIRERRMDGLPWTIRWGRFFYGAALGSAMTIGSGFLVGDTRYVRRTEFVAHEDTQKDLEKHVKDDSERFVTRAEFLAGHPATVEQNRVQDLKIKVLEQNQSWMANALYALAQKNGVQLRPPPLTP